jgi:hypothetical protein
LRVGLYQAALLLGVGIILPLLIEIVVFAIVNWKIFAIVIMEAIFEKLASSLGEIGGEDVVDLWGVSWIIGWPTPFFFSPFRVNASKLERVILLVADQLRLIERLWGVIGFH